MADNTDEKKTWRLAHGIHNGTFTSRDSTSQDGLDSLEACEASLRQQESYYRSIGYVIWFATAYAPNGKEHILRPGNTDYNNKKSFADQAAERSRYTRPERFNRDDPHKKSGKINKEKKHRFW